ncbi:MAG TPA: hypothetical protein VG893_00850 [Terracidiphilus sp.]|nr:hypothetical protein [Terracidiphilus sp.]
MRAGDTSSVVWRGIAASLCHAILGCAALIVALTSAAALHAQNVPPPPPPHPIIIPLANRLPDANDQMVMREAASQHQNFEAANALRFRQINDDTAKLLILAQDLKAKMSALGKKPVPERLQREAAVIELLAHDIQARMVLTVHAD